MVQYSTIPLAPADCSPPHAVSPHRPPLRFVASAFASYYVPPQRVSVSHGGLGASPSAGGTSPQVGGYVYAAARGSLGGAPLAVLACGWIGSLDWCNLNGLTSVYTLFPLNSHALRAPCTSPSCRPPRAAPPPPTRPPRCWTQSPGSTGASWHSAGRAVEKQTLSSFLQDAPLTKSGSL